MATKKNVTFEAAMARLEEILRALESGSEDLDTSLKLYEEGIGLIRACSDRLEAAELRVRTLRLGADGNAELVDLQRTEGAE